MCVILEDRASSFHQTLKGVQVSKYVQNPNPKEVMLQTFSLHQNFRCACFKTYNNFEIIRNMF